MCSWRWEKNLIEMVFCSCTATKILVMYSQKSNCVASVPIFTFMCLWAIYIFPGSVHIFSCSRIGRLIVGLYKSLTDTWMWKLGLRLRNSIFFLEFSVLCLCSVRLKCQMWKPNHVSSQLKKNLTITPKKNTDRTRTCNPQMQSLVQWGRRLEGWPSTATCLASWRRVNQQDVFLYTMDGPSRLPDGPHHLPRSGVDLLLNVHKTARKAWPGTLVDPCLLSNSGKLLPYPSG